MVFDTLLNAFAQPVSCTKEQVALKANDQNRVSRRAQNLAAVFRGVVAALVILPGHDVADDLDLAILDHE